MFNTRSKKLQQLVFLLHLCFSLTVFSQSNDGELIFKGFKGHSDNITLNGVSEITESGILKLTNDTAKNYGHAFFKDGFFFKNSSSGKVHSFSTAFAFGIIPQYENWCGHGLAFVITNQNELNSTLSNQYLGLVSNDDKIPNHFLAIEFDTVKDLELHDISDNHVGIDLHNLVSKAAVNASYFDQYNLTKQEIVLKKGKTIQAWIDYDSIRNELNVTLSLSSKKPGSSILSYKVDLSPFFDEYMYIGFSASTGLLYSSHYVYGWSFKINGIAQSLDLSSLPSLPQHKKKLYFGFRLGVSLLAVVFIALSVAMIMYVVKQFKNLDVIEDWERNIGPHRFSYQELQRATKDFGEKDLLGFGGFGRVYKGTLSKTQTEVAVKRINSESKQGLREFVSEIASMGRLRHRNLVQLLGWCRRGTDLLLVYELMPNGSLDKCLFDETKMVLTWEQRFKIIKGVASGLLYLHEEWEQAVIHRDIKAANVMLDSDLNGRLGDFGLAKLYEHGANISTTRVVGTLGYIAPELTKTGKPTTSSDVFAFGALLLEVVCGRRPVEPKALPEELILVDWVWDKWKKGAILELVDERLDGEYNEIEAVLVLKLGLMCSNNSPPHRPTIRQVLRYLEGENNLSDAVTAPDEYDKKNEDHSSEFKDFIHQHSASSCLAKTCTWSSSGESGGRSGVEQSSMTLLPLSGRGEGR